MWWLLACGGPGSSGDSAIDTAPPPVVVDRAPCGFTDEDATGTVDVSMQADVFHEGPSSRVDGLLLEGPTPRFHQVTVEEGECRFYHYEPVFCDPGCAGGEVCDVHGACVAFPGTTAGGPLVVRGLAAPVRIEAQSFSPGTYSTPSGLPVPLFGAGDAVGATFEDLDLSLGAEGVALLDDDLVTDGLLLVDGVDTVVTWTPSDDPEACISLRLNGSSVSHGAPLQAFVACETTDDGSLVVPASMSSAYPYGKTLEVTEGYDWPHSTLTRSTRARTATDAGPVDLIVRSTVAFLTDHPAPSP